MSTDEELTSPKRSENTENKEITLEDLYEINDYVSEASGSSLPDFTDQYSSILPSSSHSSDLPSSSTEFKDSDCETIVPQELSGASYSTTFNTDSSDDVEPTCFRTHSLWNFNKLDKNIEYKEPDVEANVGGEDYELLNEVIYSLIGMRGTFIEPVERASSQMDFSSKDVSQFRTQFKISEKLPKTLRDIINEILPLASHYICMQMFVKWAQKIESGQVNQALASVLEDLINDYYLLISQLEAELLTEKLSLHKMLFFLRPTLNTNEIIAEILAEIMANNLRGAMVLTLLYEKINLLAGDKENQKFIIHLLKFAVVPYMNILQLWIQKGEINDPQAEFFVEDYEVTRRVKLPEHYSADYWQKRYCIHGEWVPSFLVKVSGIILRTGKYLKVVRQYSKKVELSQKLKLEFDAESDEYIQVIQKAYQFASKAILNLLLKEKNMMGHLRSVRRYLLLNQGDFIAQFMDACEEELSKDVDQVLPTALENLLGLTLRTSLARNDPFKDNLHCELLTYDLVTQMSKIINNKDDDNQLAARLDLFGLECFAFRYDVQWPISLVLNDFAISKYQMLFRQLFYCKHIDRQLCKIWKQDSIAVKFSTEIEGLYRPAFTLRQRMLNAIQNFEYYMLIEVVESNWHTFIQRMRKVKNVDDLLTIHQDFLDSCLRNCMLTDNSLLNLVVFKMYNICWEFCDFMQKSQQFFLDAVKSSDASLKEMDDLHFETKQQEKAKDEVVVEDQDDSSMGAATLFLEHITFFDTQFTDVLAKFLNYVNELAVKHPSELFKSLIHRINFNHYYTDQILPL